MALSEYIRNEILLTVRRNTNLVCLYLEYNDGTFEETEKKEISFLSPSNGIMKQSKFVNFKIQSDGSTSYTIKYARLYYNSNFILDITIVNSVERELGGVFDLKNVKISVDEDTGIVNGEV